MNAINIEIAPEVSAGMTVPLLEGAAQEALQQQTVSDIEMTLVLTDDESIQRLNHDYLGIDAPTDVLAFPAGETDPETGRCYIGDVVISIPRAKEQAKNAGHPIGAEVQLLVIHGVLHLLGYDHGTAKEKSKMWGAQAEILKRIGLEIEIKE